MTGGGEDNMNMRELLFFVCGVNVGCSFCYFLATLIMSGAFDWKGR
jgi:hypothetical protein